MGMEYFAAPARRRLVHDPILPSILLSVSILHRGGDDDIRFATYAKERHRTSRKKRSVVEESAARAVGEMRHGANKIGSEEEIAGFRIRI